MRRLALYLLVLLPVATLNLCMFSEALRETLPARPPAGALDAERIPRAVVLIFDGVDYHLLTEYLDAGHLPNLAALARDGTFEPLLSEEPPESPVALASMLTGVNPGRHGIFDFVKRGADDRPENGMTEIKRSRFLAGRIPVRKPQVRSRLAAPTFTESIWRAGYSVLSLREALLFPVPDRPGAWMTSGLGTPDLAGSAGFYTIYSGRLGFEDGYTIFGGLRVPVEGGDDGLTFDTWLWGTQDPTLGAGPSGENQRARIPLRFVRTSENGRRGVRIELQGQQEFVPDKERSGFFPAIFALNTLPAAREVPGVVRFEVLNLDPLEVMADPVQIDPRDAYFPMSTPRNYGSFLWHQYGPFETMGWQEQTFALNDRFQTDEGFLRDLLEDMDRGTVTLLKEMRRVRKGHTAPPRCVFYTFTATDRACHGFWRHRDKGHPEHDPTSAFARTDPILKVFRRMDAIVGRVRATLEPSDTLIVCSDHGFQTWRWEVHVNQWLLDNGYLVLNEDAAQKDLGGFFTFKKEREAVDWNRTRAFALGLGQIYLNVKGRDAHGIVPASGKRALMEELKAKLLELTNPYRTAQDERDGIPARVLRRVTILEDVWDFGEDPPPAHVPDLQLGFERGYRISWQTALLGGMGAHGDVFTLNQVPWSGDHCSTAPELVPGVLLVNRPLRPETAGRNFHVRDIAATLLEHFGVDRAHLHGESRPIPIVRPPTPD